MEQVTPIKLADALKAVHGEKPDYGPFCRWANNQDYLAELVVRWHKTMVEGINSVDRGTPVGMDSTTEGWVRPGSGMDFWQVTNNTEFLLPVSQPHHSRDPSQCGEETQDAGLWFGGYGLYQYPPEYYDDDFLPWWGVFRGINLMALFHGTAGDTLEPISWELLARSRPLRRNEEDIRQHSRTERGNCQTPIQWPTDDRWDCGRVFAFQRELRGCFENAPSGCGVVHPRFRGRRLFLHAGMGGNDQLAIRHRPILRCHP